MKQIILSLLVIVAVITLIVISFTVNQVNQEEQQLKSDLQFRSILLAESLKETVEPNFINRSESYLQSIVTRFTDKERFAGLGIYDNKGQVIALSSTVPDSTISAQVVATNAMDSDKANGDFMTVNRKPLYVLAVPLHQDQSVVGSLMIIQNAGYISERLEEIWRTNLIRLAVQASLLTIAILMILRWIIYAPIKVIVENLKSARSGSNRKNTKGLTNSFLFGPLINEITNIRASLTEARLSASQEARLRLQKIDSPWTAKRLEEFIKDTLKGRTIFMVSNREPYIHTKNGNKISYYFPASGMATAIEPVMQAAGGIWIAHGAGDADRLVVDKKDHVRVPPDEPKYTLRRVWLTEEEEKGFYDGFSNEGLWPLCHNAHTRPTFRKEDWDQYLKVNQKYADTVLEEIKHHEKPVVLIQDFHLALVPRMVKSQKPSATIGIFWHIPWPNPESFSICPWKKEILNGMLGADLLGFHTQLHCNNFIETVGRELESLIDFEQFTITRNNHTSFVKPFPISIAFPNGISTANFDYKLAAEKFKKQYGIKTKYIGLGIDRMDYTKGIIERLKAVEIFLNKNPEYQGNFTFIQIAAPSRTKVKKYQEFSEDVKNEVERINNIYKKNGITPILLIIRHHNHEEIQTLYKMANVCLVTSLHDGMNLVSKEFIAARDDERGVLILSQYTGASRELKDALIINPYNGEQTADAIKQAVDMKPSEQIRRMHNLRETLSSNNVYRWSAELLKAMANL